MTEIFHPNFGSHGEVSLDIIESRMWTPATTLKTILLSLQSLIIDPNFYRVINDNYVKVYTIDKEIAHQKARECNQLFANIRED